jgi:NAD(P)-dependent dehydrogenase (short-subunit alcohol dehydrogenase family)
MNELRFDHRVAIVTGAGRGIGREHALLLAARGAAVVVNDAGVATDGSAGPEDPAAAVCSEILAAGGVAIADRTRMGDRASAEHLITTAVDEFGRVDVLVNNAGVVQADWDTSLAVNLSASFWAVRAAWSTFTDQRYGRVLSTTSAAGLFGLQRPNHSPLDFYAYAAAKAGICALTRDLAAEGASLGIRTNAVAPFAHSRLTARHPDAATVAWLSRRFPPAAVAKACLPLLHESCPVNGQILSTGGGRIAGVFTGETHGWAEPDASPEQFLLHMEQAFAVEPFTVPGSTQDEAVLYADALRPREPTR